MEFMRLPKVVLIPVLTGKENNKKFLLEAVGSAKKVVVVYLIDQSTGMTASEITKELQEKEVLLNQIDELIHSIGKKVKVYNEWGNLTEKISVISQRENVKEIVVQKRSKLAQKEIGLIKELGLPVREISF